MVQALPPSRFRGRVGVMNGRLYDPVVGRFLSPDPVIIKQIFMNYIPVILQGYILTNYSIVTPIKK